MESQSCWLTPTPISTETAIALNTCLKQHRSTITRPHPGAVARSTIHVANAAAMFAVGPSLVIPVTDAAAKP